MDEEEEVIDVQLKDIRGTEKMQATYDAYAASPFSDPVIDTLRLIFFSESTMEGKIISVKKLHDLFHESNVEKLPCPGFKKIRSLIDTWKREIS